MASHRLWDGQGGALGGLHAGSLAAGVGQATGVPTGGGHSVPGPPVPPVAPRSFPREGALRHGDSTPLVYLDLTWGAECNV